MSLVMNEPLSFHFRGLPIQGVYTQESCEATYNLKTRDGDVFLPTYPRTGTTWTQNIMLSLRLGVEALAETNAGWLEVQSIFPYLEIEPVKGVSGVEKALQLESPRYMKTHFPTAQSPQEIFAYKRKCVVVLRNMKESCVSNYHFYNNNEHLRPFASNTFEEFCERYLSGDLTYGSQWEFNKSWLDYAEENPDTVMVLHYEDIKRDFAREVRRLAEFLDIKEAVSDENLQRIKEFCSMGSMKERYNKFESVKNFVREGMTDSWKTMMSDEIVGKFDEKTKEYFGNKPELLAKLS